MEQKLSLPFVKLKRLSNYEGKGGHQRAYTLGGTNRDNVKVKVYREHPALDSLVEQPLVNGASNALDSDHSRKKANRISGGASVISNVSKEKLLAGLKKTFASVTKKTDKFMEKGGQESSKPYVSKHDRYDGHNRHKTQHREETHYNVHDKHRERSKNIETSRGVKATNAYGHSSSSQGHGQGYRSQKHVTGSQLKMTGKPFDHKHVTGSQLKMAGKPVDQDSLPLSQKELIGMGKYFRTRLRAMLKQGHIKSAEFEPWNILTGYTALQSDGKKRGRKRAGETSQREPRSSDAVSPKRVSHRASKGKTSKYDESTFDLISKKTKKTPESAHSHQNASASKRPVENKEQQNRAPMRSLPDDTNTEIDDVTDLLEAYQERMCREENLVVEDYEETITIRGGYYPLPKTLTSPPPSPQCPTLKCPTPCLFHPLHPIEAYQERMCREENLVVEDYEGTITIRGGCDHSSST